MMASILKRLAVSSAAAEVCCVRTFTTSASWSQKVRELSSRESSLTDKATICFTTDVKREVISLSEALQCLRAYSLRPVPETLELGLLINMTVKKGKVRDSFRGSMLYPHRFGVQRRVLLLAEEEVLAKAEGADLTGGDDVIAKLERGSHDLEFDVCIATPNMYYKMQHLQKALRVKMPNPRRGTVVNHDQVNQAILTFQQSKTFRCSKQGVINCSIGLIDFEDAVIEANIRCLLAAVLEHRGVVSELSFVRRATLSSSFGPGFDITMQDLFLYMP